MDPGLDPDLQILSVDWNFGLQTSTSFLGDM